MSIIRRIDELYNSGKSEGEVVSLLKSEGYSPRDIDESLSQHSIKSAVSNDSQAPIPDSSMQQSIMSNPNRNQQFVQQNVPAPSPMPAPSPSGDSYDQPPQVSDYSQSYGSDPQYDSQYDSQSYSADYSQPYSNAQSSETVSEIAEQIVDEKISKFKREISSLDEFKSGVNTKIDLLKERLKRIEGIIDTLQDSIVRKIGQYGESIENLGNDLHMTQESFSKVVSPLLEKSKALVKKRTYHRRKKTKKRSKKKSK